VRTPGRVVLAMKLAVLIRLHFVVTLTQRVAPTGRTVRTAAMSSFLPSLFFCTSHNLKAGNVGTTYYPDLLSEPYGPYICGVYRIPQCLFVNFGATGE